ncbi:MAG: cobyric acid synthase [Clostridia bacterium]|nr:cobyric acid synthase [Clostridia bacterium]MBR3038839.1 cobyric acid synthase [Clostridia bacterium]
MANAIMIQGTMSNAGKSLIAAGLCRVFRQDGYRVAPFKAQNMALNSFITKEGLEMGRAQVVQAEAAGVEPSVLMNPILLKPTSDMGSQVIVNGEVYAQLSARDYFRIKKTLMPKVMQAYDTLSGQNDVIVIEGAGSPAEINLKDADVFVNMGMAKAAKAPVLLVGDIDRGGVFAQLYGTVALLDPDERALVKGVIINKFRGDESILTPGLKQLEALTGVPVVGVVPYVHLDIDDEDSLSERLENRPAALVDIAVMRLPRLSNFTDFRTLEAIDGVSVRYVTSPHTFGEPDLVILPGTKNTMADLLWLRQSGLEAKILRFADTGGAVFGICGGFQMLGRALNDPHGVEHGGTLRGMGLLPVETTFTEQKTRTRVSGAFGNLSGAFRALSGLPFAGYEIHMGETETGVPIAKITDAVTGAAKTDGCQNGNVCGTYVHGILDGDAVAGALVRALAERKGVDPALLGKVSGEAHKQRQYDLLADTIRSHMDMNAIYRILREGV